MSHRESTFAESESGWENVFRNGLKPSKVMKEEAAGTIKVGRNSPSLHQRRRIDPSLNASTARASRLLKGTCPFLQGMKNEMILWGKRPQEISGQTKKTKHITSVLSPAEWLPG